MMSLKELVATKSSVTYAIMLLCIWFGSTVVSQFDLYIPIPIINMIMLVSLVLLLLMSRNIDKSENKTTITPDLMIPLEKVSLSIKEFQTTIQDMIQGQVAKDDSVKEQSDDFTLDDVIKFLQSIGLVVDAPKSEVEGGTVG